MSAEPQHPDLRERFWRLRRADGQIVTCAAFFSKVLGFEVRAWLENHDVLWTRRVPNFDSARALAEE
jgi:hypothetical protein